jgi:hypothetical protein
MIKTQTNSETIGSISPRTTPASARGLPPFSRASLRPRYAEDHRGQPQRDPKHEPTELRKGEARESGTHSQGQGSICMAVV